MTIERGRVISGRRSSPRAIALSIAARKRASIAISRSRLYSPTTSSPGWNGVRLLATYGSGLRTRLPFEDIEHATREGKEDSGARLNPITESGKAAARKQDERARLSLRAREARAWPWGHLSWKSA
jgi:hypothetical protein